MSHREQSSPGEPAKYACVLGEWEGVGVGGSDQEEDVASEKQISFSLCHAQLQGHLL